MKCSLIVSMIAAFALPAVAAEISNVSIVQERPFSTDVRITYDLAGLTENESVDVALSCTADGVAVTPAEAGLSGDLRDVHGNGTHQIRLDPKVAFGGNLGVQALLKFRVSLTAEPASERNREVLYKIFDLSEKSVTDVSRGALLNGAYGSVETDFGRIGPGYTTTLDDVLIWTGVTNDIAYKTTKLVLRKIPSGEFKSFRLLSEMPETPNASLAFDYWIGVFELTQGQENLIGKGTRKDILFVGETLPVQQASLQYAYNNSQTYMKDHSSTNEEWLANYSTSLLYKLANLFKSGDSYPYDFELPTQVQWMRAMRAGADSFYYDGLPEPDNVESNAQMDVLARYRYNGGLVDNGDGTVTTNIAQVGSYRPNAYGLYDMLGNVRELCRDRVALNKDLWKAGGENQLATASGNGLVRWGGGFQDGGRASYVEDSIDRGISYEEGNLHATSVGGDCTRLGMRICMMTMADGKKYFSPDHVNQPKASKE